MYRRGAIPARHQCAPCSFSLLRAAAFGTGCCRPTCLCQPGLPPHMRSLEVQEGLSHCPAHSSPSSMACLIKNPINLKIVHVVLNQLEVSVRIR